MVELTPILLARAMPKAHPADRARFIDPLNDALREFGVVDPAHVAALLAQVGHESGLLRLTAENLNYSAQALLAVFPRYFTTGQAEEYARKPERIGSRVYASRMGNGDEASGDGFRFRGRGLIQVTGRDNYRVCGSALGLDLEARPELLETPVQASRSACWFWTANRLGAWIDRGDFDGCCDVVNRGRKTQALGDSNGWADRLELYHRARLALGLTEEV